MDELDQRVRQASKAEDIHEAFRETRLKLQGQLREQVSNSMHYIVQDALTKVNVERIQGALDIFDGLMRDLDDFWQGHLNKMDTVAEDASRLIGAARRAVWENALREADADWQTFRDVQNGKWLGMFRGLGAEEMSAEYAQAANLLGEMQDNWAYFFSKRREIYDEFYSLSEGLERNQALSLGEIGAERSRLWAEAGRKLNEEYTQALRGEDELQTLLNRAFAEQYGRQFSGLGDAAMAEAETSAFGWRDQVQMTRRKMAAAQAAWRGGKLPDELARTWGQDVLPAELLERIYQLNGGRPAWALDFKVREEMSRRFGREIYQPFVRELLDASHRYAPDVPKATPSIVSLGEAPAAQPFHPSAPTERFAGMLREGASQPFQGASQPARPWTMETQPFQGAARRQVQEVLRLAREYDIPSATETGAPTNRQIINIVRKYGGERGQAVKRIEDVTPELAREAFEARKAAGAEPSPETGALRAAGSEDISQAVERAGRVEKALRGIEPGESVPVRAGITNVKGHTETELDSLVRRADELLKSGNHEGAEKLYREAVEPGLEHMRAVLGDKANELDFSYSKFLQQPEPGIFSNYSIQSEEGALETLYALSKMAEEFNQESFIFHYPVKGDFRLGEPITEYGVESIIEPGATLKFKKALSREQIGLIDEITNELGITGYQLSPDNKQIDIVYLTFYNKVKLGDVIGELDDKKRIEFYRSLGQLAGKLHARRVVSSVETDFRRAWVGVHEGGGPGTGAIRASDWHDLYEAAFGDQAAAIQQRIKENPYRVVRPPAEGVAAQRPGRAAQTAPAVGAPLGTADEFAHFPIEEGLLETWARDVRPALDRAERGLAEQFGAGSPAGPLLREGAARPLGEPYSPHAWG